jgi:hypothetical protein
MIGVICADRQRRVVGEFFQLFKTPWAFFENGRTYDVVLTTIATELGSLDARLVIVFGSAEMPGDSGLGIVTGAPVTTALLHSNGDCLPIYRGALPLRGGMRTRAVCAGGNEPLVVDGLFDQDQVIRCGYDLFSEVEFLLSNGQPPQNGQTPTLDLHIAWLRSWILESGIPLWEIPPAPPGSDFLACLTHDVDFLGIRRHRFDTTLAGFLLRASIGSVISLTMGRHSLKHLLRNWLALLSLPLVYAGILEDFWLPFDRYLQVDGNYRSTFFLIPFRGRAGRALQGSHHRKRAVQYGVADTQGWMPRLRSRGAEVAVHGIDAWNDTVLAQEELRAVSEVAGESALGVRMHWLFFRQASFEIVDRAGFMYDSSIGYNDAVGFRAGTTQVFRPLTSERLLELPLHIQDTSLFFRRRMHRTEAEAVALCGEILDWMQRLGGALTISWHERSLVPERQWDGPYRELLGQLQTRNASVRTASDVVSWFRTRRAMELQGLELGPSALHDALSGTGGPRNGTQLRVRIHNGRDGREYYDAGFVDMPVDVAELEKILGLETRAG